MPRRHGAGTTSVIEVYAKTRVLPVSKLSVFNPGRSPTVPTDRALRPTVALGTSGLKRGRAAPEAIGELKLGPPQKSTVTPCSSVSPRPAMATSLRVTNSHDPKPPFALALAVHCECI